MRNLLLTLVGVFLVSVSFVTGAAAQQAVVPVVEKVKSSVQAVGTGERAKVEVKLRDGAKVKGSIAAINADAFDVADSKTGTIRSIPYTDVASVKKQRSGLKPRTWVII